MQPSNHFLSSLQMIKQAIQWLTGLFWLTEEEEKDAGISYPNEQYYG